MSLWLGLLSVAEQHHLCLPLPFCSLACSLQMSAPVCCYFSPPACPAQLSASININGRPRGDFLPHRKVPFGEHSASFLEAAAACRRALCQCALSDAGLLFQLLVRRRPRELCLQQGCGIQGEGFRFKDLAVTSMSFRQQGQQPRLWEL